MGSTRDLVGTAHPRLLAAGSLAAELGIAVTLLVPRTAGAATAAAAALLLLFTAVLVRAALRGSEASCNCFGALSSAAPVGAREVLRNTVLLAVTVLALLGAPTMPEDLALWIAVCTALLLAGGALAAVTHLARGLHAAGVPTGADAGPGEDEEMYPVGSHLAVPGATGPVLVGVLSTTCPPCRLAAPVYDQYAAMNGLQRVALVDDARGPGEQLLAELDRLGMPHLLLAAHPELAPASSVRPGWALLDADGRVEASGTGSGEIRVPARA